MADSIIEKVIEKYLSDVLKYQNLPEYLIIARISLDQWKPHELRAITLSDERNKYDIFHAGHPGNPRTSTDPRDLNILSSALVSQGYEVHAFAYREKRYQPIAAAGAKPA
jgi:hypothetical protein